jgi:hypothetical protein
MATPIVSPPLATPIISYGNDQYTNVGTSVCPCPVAGGVFFCPVSVGGGLKVKLQQPTNKRVRLKLGNKYCKQRRVL